MTQAHDYQVGYQGVVYYGPPGTEPQTELPEVLSLNFRASVGGTSLTPRATGGVEMQEPGLFRFGIDMSIPYEPEGVAWKAFATAFYNRLPLAVGVHAATGDNGVEGDYIITEFSQDEPQGDAVATKISLAPNFRYGRTVAPWGINGGPETIPPT